MSAEWDADEEKDRALFEQRARASRARADVPSLEAVLRAARAEAVETPSSRGRAWSGLAVAAACLIAIVKVWPHDASPSKITADVERVTSPGSERGGAMCEESEVEACTSDPTCSGAAPAPPPVQDDQACMAPQVSFASFESPSTLSCDLVEGECSSTR